MKKRDRFLKEIRAAAGTNDNGADDPASTVIYHFHGPVTVNIKNGRFDGNPTPRFAGKTALSRQNLVPRRSVVAALESLPPAHWDQD